MLGKAGFGIDRKEMSKTGRFLLFFVLAYLVLSGIFWAIFPLQKTELLVANASLFILSLFGISGKVIVQEPILLNLSNGTSIVFSELCTGAMEMLIIVSAIIASHGIEWRKRIFGAAASVFVVQAFNLTRIASTVLVISGNNSLETIEFTHNVLFRVFLFIVIAGTYMAWFYSSVKEQA